MSGLPSNPSHEPQPVWELATMYPAQGCWSEEEYLELTEGTNRLIELTDGSLEFLALPTRVHQRIVTFLLAVFSAFVDARQLGEVLPGGIRIRTADGKFRIPELIFLSWEKEAAWGGDRFLRGTDIAVEVVSDDDQSHRHGYALKVATYAAAGIPEYWIVDPGDKKIVVYCLDSGAGSYTEHGTFKPGESATSVLFDGFAVDVAAVFDAAKLR